MNNFAESLALTLKYEGGFVNDPHDPGGATNMGITIGTLGAYFGRPVTVHDVKSLSLDTVSQIYRTTYWDRIRGDELPDGVDCALFDFAVNSGPKRAIIGLQRAVGVADDGKLGPWTLRAVSLCGAQNAVDWLCQDRMDMLRSLSTWPHFGKGWTSRVTAIQLAARAMAQKPKGHGQS